MLGAATSTRLQHNLAELFSILSSFQKTQKLTLLC
jgi:hypothetical protein